MAHAIDPSRSEVRLEASSSVHPIHGSAEEIDGEVVTDESGAITAMRLELPISGIRSGNGLYDRSLGRAVDARKHPRIVAESTSVEVDADDRYRVRGTVSFHGRTVEVTGTVRISGNGSSVAGTRRIVGTHTFDVRDFGVQPPRLLGLRVHPEVTISVDLMTRQGDDHA